MEFVKKSIHLITLRQTNILSAAFVIMAMTVFSQLLGLIRQRLLVSHFGAYSNLGIYSTATQIPDSLFQVIIAGGLASAFIPVFSDFYAKGKDDEAYRFASSTILIGMLVFAFFGLLLLFFTPYILLPANLGGHYSQAQMTLMANLVRVVIFAQLLIIVASFFSAILQSYNRFLIPGFAAAMYNLGIILGIVLFSHTYGIFAPAYGAIIGALFFAVVQIPLLRKLHFKFHPQLSLSAPGVKKFIHLMWPRTISIAITQFGILFTLPLISFLADPGRNRIIFDFAQTLAFAPTVLFGQSIAQAAFPVLSRERDRLDQFKLTFTTSFTQLLYVILPFSVLFLVLRIPIVRLVYGAPRLDWNATVLIGTTLACFTISIFSQALLYLVSRAFYALHDTRTPLIVSFITTVLMLLLSLGFITYYQWGVAGIALAYSLASFLQLLILFIILDHRIGGFFHSGLFISIGKIFTAAFFTGIALYIPIKLLDKLVFDTTHTINLLMLSGISSFIGLLLYLLLTWLLNVKEAMLFIVAFKKIDTWKEVLFRSDETIDPKRLNT